MTSTSPPAADRSTRPLPRATRMVPVPLVLVASLAAGACGATAPTPSREGTVTSPGSSRPSTLSEGLPSASVLLHRSEAHATGRTTGHVVGSSGSGESAVVVDVTGRLDGTNQRLRVTLGRRTATILTVDGTSYLLGPGPTSARAADASPASLLALALPQLDRGRARALAGLTVGGLVQAAFDDPAVASLAGGTVSRTTVDGRPAYELRGRGGGARVVVTADGSAHLLRVTGLGGQLSELSFDRWDDAEPFWVPGPAKTIEPPHD